MIQTNALNRSNLLHACAFNFELPSIISSLEYVKTGISEAQLVQYQILLFIVSIVYTRVHSINSIHQSYIQCRISCACYLLSGVLSCIPMVYMDVSLVIGAHVCREIGTLICSRHLMDHKFEEKSPFSFPHAELVPSYHLI